MTFDGRTEDPWHSPTVAGLYTEATDLRYRFDSSGNVHLRGEIIRNLAASGDLLFTLPPEYAPDATVRVIIGTAPSSALGQVAIFTTGEVRLYELQGTPTSYYVDCVFSAL